jgi:hypothetical protein
MRSTKLLAELITQRANTIFISFNLNSRIKVIKIKITDIITIIIPPNSLTPRY